LSVFKHATSMSGQGSSFLLQETKPHPIKKRHPSNYLALWLRQPIYCKKVAILLFPCNSVQQKMWRKHYNKQNRAVLEESTEQISDIRTDIVMKSDYTTRKLSKWHHVKAVTFWRIWNQSKNCSQGWIQEQHLVWWWIALISVC